MTEPVHVPKQGIGARLWRVFRATVLNQASGFVIQIVQVPLFLHYWRTEAYGEWLILFTFPAYLSLANISIPGIASNEMAILAGRGDRREMLEVLHSTVVMVAAISVFLLVAVYGFAASGWLAHWFSFPDVGQAQAGWTIEMLVFYVCGCQVMGIIDACLRTGGYYADSLTLEALTRIIELVLVVITLMLGGQALAVAGAYALARVIGNVLGLLWARRRVPWIRLGISEAKTAQMRKLLLPGVTYMGWGLGNAVNLQGFVMLVGHQFGSAMVVMFGTIRTLTRVILQLLMMVNSVVFAEISMAHGREDLETLRMLHNRSCSVAFWIAGTMGAGLLVLGPAIHGIWTHHQVKTDLPTLYLLTLGVVLMGLWNTSSTVLAATNRHKVIATGFALINVLGLAVATGLTKVIGYVAVPLTLVAIEAALVVFILRRTLPAVHEPVGNFLKMLTKPPLFLLDALRARSKQT